MLLLCCAALLCSGALFGSAAVLCFCALLLCCSVLLCRGFALCRCAAVLLCCGAAELLGFCVAVPLGAAALRWPSAGLLLCRTAFSPALPVQPVWSYSLSRASRTYQIYLSVFLAVLSLSLRVRSRLP